MAQAERSAEGPTGKALAVLSAVADRRRPVAIAEVAALLDLPLPTAHRIVAQLLEAGWLQRSLASRRVAVGPRLIEMAWSVAAAAFGDAARDALLRDLAEELGEQVEVGTVRAGQVVYLATARAVRPASLQFEPGRRAPLHCTSTGKLHLAEMPPAQRERLVRSLALERRTPRTVTEPDALLAELETVQAQGFALTSEELVEGVAGGAVPIRDARGRMVAALGVTVPLARLGEAGPRALIPALRRTAAALSGSLDPEEADDSCPNTEEPSP